MVESKQRGRGGEVGSRGLHSLHNKRKMERSRPWTLSSNLDPNIGLSLSRNCRKQTHEY